MHPIVNEGTTSSRLRLCDFIIMMNSNMIFATRVDINFLTKQCTRHSRAFDMPAWITYAPRAIPLLEVSWLRGAPEPEVVRVPLLPVCFNARACSLASHVNVPQFSIAREVCGIKGKSVCNTIRKTFFLKRFRERNLLLYIVGRARELYVFYSDIELGKIVN